MTTMSAGRTPALFDFNLLVGCDIAYVENVSRSTALDHARRLSKDRDTDVQVCDSRRHIIARFSRGEGGLAPEFYMRRYPRLVAHIICESLGYATPTTAARILSDCHARRQNWCEWIYSCYKCDPLPMLRQAIRTRKYHHGYMADYGQARALVAEAVNGGEEPLFASWF